ncbi:ATP-binding protein [Ralstonia sp. UBA689]|uniref:ATP-binding protein n=1 Tax=Ralstonia sp. UBA689 TaxID=1947373 RepID=UPI0026002FE2|nr:ATP-binding protein [Ralstonia sp. UBA689]
MSQEIEIELSPQQPDINALVAWLRAFFAEHGLSDALCQRFAIALDEVVTNIVEYGAPRQPIKVFILIDNREVRVQVVDDGIAFDPLQIPAPDTEAGIDERPIGGLGIFLVKKMMDSVAYEYRDERNRLSFSKRIARQRIQTSIGNHTDRGEQDWKSKKLARVPSSF